mmetsp:Transcript_21017/g.54779  ORF Transcript_21017/g.54779 Transcript_21017/m.54779 type:complete len:294 (+) Transcript_21017:3730-4611(+)
MEPARTNVSLRGRDAPFNFSSSASKSAGPQSLLIGSPSIATNSSFLGSSSPAGPSSLCILSTRTRDAPPVGDVISRNTTPRGLPSSGNSRLKTDGLLSTPTRHGKGPLINRCVRRSNAVSASTSVRSSASKATRSSKTCKPAHDPFSTLTEALENSSLRAKHSVNDEGGCSQVAFSRTGSSAMCWGGASSKDGAFGESSGSSKGVSLTSRRKTSTNGLGFRANSVVHFLNSSVVRGVKGGSFWTPTNSSPDCMVPFCGHVSLTSNTSIARFPSTSGSNRSWIPRGWSGRKVAS